MSTDTATETEETTTEAPKEDLKAQTSASLLERRDALAEEATAALDGDWSEYLALAEQERVLTEELDRRHSVKVPVPAPGKVPVAASERMDTLRAEIAEAEKALEAFAGVEPRGHNPYAPKWGETVEELEEPQRQKAKAFLNLERKRQDLAALERRLQFAENTDDEITTTLEDSQVERESLMKDLKQAQAEHRPALERKLNRQIEEATSRWLSLEVESKTRSKIRLRESGLDQMAERAATKQRKQNLIDWQARRKELENDLQTALSHPRNPVEAQEVRHLWVDSLAEAQQAIEAHEKAIASNAPHPRAELAAIRAQLDARAPRPSGSW